MSEKKEQFKVLVVDDEEDIRDLLSTFFMDEGFEVVEASGGNAAYEVAKSTRFHAIVSDIRMPGGDGIELLKKIRAINSHMPIVVLITGFSDVPAEEAERLGAIKVIQKPLNLRSLVTFVRHKCSSLSELPLGFD